MAVIGVLGFYRTGNFGDDVMALMVAKRLIQAGQSVIILGLPEPLAQLVGAASIQSADKLAETADAFVIGGGGLLTDFDGALSDPAQRAVDHDCARVALIARKAGKPCFAVSIGGSSPTMTRGVRTGVIVYLMSPQFRGATTRLRCDHAFLERLYRLSRDEPPALAAFPDMVLSAARLFPNAAADLPPRPDDRPIVAWSPGERRMDLRRVRDILKWIGSNDAVRVVVTHNGRGEAARIAQKFPASRSLEHVAFDSPLPMLRFLAGVDVMVGPRLHLGMTALAMGTPFVAFNCVRKTRLAMNEAGWTQHILDADPARSTEAMRKICESARRENAPLTSLPANIDKARDAAATHLEWLVEQLASHV